MSHHHHHTHHAARRAEFAERGLAFAVDVALFAAIRQVILKAVDPDLPARLNEKGFLVTIALAALFLVYQAFFSCEGRVTAGKRLLGLRVTDGADEPLDLGRAVMRALGYIPSSFLSLGFFWSLVDSHGRAWHDLTAGSRVVSDRPVGRVRGPVLRAAAGLAIALFALGVGWNGIWEPRYLKLMTVARAKAGFNEVKILQTSYHQRNGRYAGSLFALAEVSIDPTGFLRDMAALYDLKAVRVQADQDRWAIAARARDVDSTLVAAHGP